MEMGAGEGWLELLGKQELQLRKFTPLLVPVSILVGFHNKTP